MEAGHAAARPDVEKVHGVLTQPSIERRSVFRSPEPGGSLGRAVEVRVAGSVEPFVRGHAQINSLVDLAGQEDRHPDHVHDGV